MALQTSIVRTPYKRYRDVREAEYFGGTDNIHYGRILSDRHRRHALEHGKPPARSASTPPKPPSGRLPVTSLGFDKYHHFSENNIRWNARDRPALEGESTFADKRFMKYVMEQWEAGRRPRTPSTKAYMDLAIKLQQEADFPRLTSEYKPGATRVRVFPERHKTSDELYWQKVPKMHSGHSHNPLEANIV